MTTPAIDTPPAATMPVTIGDRAPSITDRAHVTRTVVGPIETATDTIFGLTRIAGIAGTIEIAETIEIIGSTALVATATLRTTTLREIVIAMPITAAETVATTIAETVAMTIAETVAIVIAQTVASSAATENGAVATQIAVTVTGNGNRWWLTQAVVATRPQAGNGRPHKHRNAAACGQSSPRAEVAPRRRLRASSARTCAFSPTVIFAR